MSDAKRTASQDSARPSSRSVALLETNEKHLTHPNVAAFLKAIAAAEGGGYDFKYGALKGRSNDRWRFTDMSTHPGRALTARPLQPGCIKSRARPSSIMAPSLD